jgi:hypothetical protein
MDASLSLKCPSLARSFSLNSSLNETLTTTCHVHACSCQPYCTRMMHRMYRLGKNDTYSQIAEFTEKLVTNEDAGVWMSISSIPLTHWSSDTLRRSWKKSLFATNALFFARAHVLSLTTQTLVVSCVALYSSHDKFWKRSAAKVHHGRWLLGSKLMMRDV